MKLKPGVPTVENYLANLKTPHFRFMERFSNVFLRKNKPYLRKYSLRWTSDPLHNWSRQYEYLYVFEEIRKFLKLKKNKELSILDAGSGITFFPYFLYDQIPKVQMHCCDYDASLEAIYRNINRDMKNAPHFIHADIRKLPLKKEAYDIIYCISVLEHTEEFDKIVREFKRALKPDGILILTFDIAINDLGDIPRSKVFTLTESIMKEFELSEPLDLKKEMALLDSNTVLTTAYVKNWRRDLLPWRFSVIIFLKNLLKLRMDGDYFTNLAFFCGTFKPQKK